MNTRSAVLAVALLFVPAAVIAADWQHVVQACDDAARQPGTPAAGSKGLSIHDLNKGSSTISKWDKRYPWEDCVLKVAGLEPVGVTFGSLAPGGGFGLGPRVQGDLNRGRVQSHLVAHGLMSPANTSYVVEGRYDVMMPSFGQWNAATATFEDQIVISPFVRRTDLHEVPFYGLGNSTGVATAYREQRTEGGIFGSVPFASWFAAGGGISYLAPSIRRTTGSQEPIQNQYHAADVPGLDVQPNFVDLKAFIRLHTPSLTRQTRHRHDARLTYDVFPDRDSNGYSFARLQLFGTGSYELRRRSDNPFDRTAFQNFWCEQLVGNECRFGNLVLDGLVTTEFASTGQAVPFYLQDTLGGTDRDGLDTLRGLRDFQLRAPNRVLLQAEFYKDVNGWFGVYGFYDTGAVAPRRNDLGVGHWRHDFGPGLFVRAGGRVVLRAFVAFGSGEGTRGGFKVLGSL